MLAAKEEIRIEQAVVHIMDSALGVPVLSDTLLDCSSDFADFLKAHIFRIDTSDDVKNGTFEEEASVFQLLEEWNPEKFLGDFPENSRGVIHADEPEYRHSGSGFAGGGVQCGETPVSGAFKDELQNFVYPSDQCRPLGK